MSLKARRGKMTRLRRRGPVFYGIHSSEVAMWSGEEILRPLSAAALEREAKWSEAIVRAMRYGYAEVEPGIIVSHLSTERLPNTHATITEIDDEPED